MNPITVAILGLGNVGRAFLEHCIPSSSEIEVRAAADSTGAAIISDVAAARSLLQHKSAQQPIAQFTHPRASALATEDLLSRLPALGIRVLIDCLPTNPVEGQPGLRILVAALSQGTR